VCAGSRRKKNDKVTIFPGREKKEKVGCEPAQTQNDPLCLTDAEGKQPDPLKGWSLAVRVEKLNRPSGTSTHRHLEALKYNQIITARREAPQVAFLVTIVVGQGPPVACIRVCDYKTRGRKETIPEKCNGWGPFFFPENYLA